MFILGLLCSMVVPNGSFPLPRALFSPVAGEEADKPAKIKSVSQFYCAEPDGDETEVSTGTEGSREWSDSQDGDTPVKKRKLSVIQKQTSDVSHAISEEPSTRFKTLAQLLEPRRNERIKSHPKRPKFCRSSEVTGRDSCRANGKTFQGNIELIVNLVFEKEFGNDAPSSSNYSVDKAAIPEGLPPGDDSIEDYEASVKLGVSSAIPECREEEEEDQVFDTIRDPFSLTIARFFTKAGAEFPSSFRAQMKWREVDAGDSDPLILVNRKCKVYCASEQEWRTVFISGYDQNTRKHMIKHEKDERWHPLIRDRIAFYISLDEKLNVFCGRQERCPWDDKADELLVFAANAESFGTFHHGDVVWAETPGFPMWPAFVMDEQHARLCGLEISICSKTIPVHYFGSHDCARIKNTRVVGFSKGLLESYHLNCTRIAFFRGLEEVDRYFREQKLSDIMAYLREEVLSILSQDKHFEASEDDEEFVGDERKHKVRKSLESISECPIKLGSLRVLSLGKIVKDSEYFHDQQYIWTEGYTSIRKFFSMKDPSAMVNYKMEILRNSNARTMPLFRVTPDDCEQVEGSSAGACWKKIFDKLQKARNKLNPSLKGQTDKKRQLNRSGTAMFGLTHPRVSRLIQALPYARVCSKFKVWAEAIPSEDLDGLLPAGFKHVEADWKHLDRCSVCDTNEECEGNVLSQCDKCRMLVHRNCYGVLEAPKDSWLCNLCDFNSPRRLPPCCLCPIKGGAMKRTTDGRWVHLACALWIPETSCVDIERMEPIEGIHSINKERWKLTCTICNVPYGACIQCADHHCRVSFHPLCARAAGFSTKVLEGIRRKRNKITGVQEEERSVQLLSYCKKHTHTRKNSSSKVNIDCHDDYPYAFQNSSGCARSEPYNVSARRGRREPEPYAAALAKRSFLENRPYVVSGRLHHLHNGTNGSNSKKSVALSTSQRFLYMRNSLHRRLTFGKSAIHGWGLFAKKPHEAGDMVIEYAGEIIRAVVADVRERSFYNSLVGAGTYMFSIDNERVIDATRSGSIAHLINHSCEPNCYSRVVATSGRERIIIFAKQTIAGGQEVTYDYRFTSMGEQLACHCGSPACRGIVNVTDEEDESGRILVRASEVTKWQPPSSSGCK